MKKIIAMACVSFLLYSCGSFKTVDMSKLHMEMTKAEVADMFGSPDRVLFAGAVDDGYEEVLQYRTYNNELYALTFFNDRLKSYGFIAEDYPPDYVHPHPPVYNPLFPPVKPPVRPSENTRPGSSGSGGSTRPETTRPGNSGAATRPETSGQGSSTRPATRPATRPETTPADTRNTDAGTREKLEK